MRQKVATRIVARLPTELLSSTLAPTTTTATIPSPRSPYTHVLRRNFVGNSTATHTIVVLYDVLVPADKWSRLSYLDRDLDRDLDRGLDRGPCCDPYYDLDGELKIVVQVVILIVA